MGSIKNKIVAAFFDALCGERSDGIGGLIYDSRVFFKLAKLTETFSGRTTNGDKLLQRWEHIGAQVDEVCGYIYIIRARACVRELAAVSARVEIMEKVWGRLSASRKSPLRSVVMISGAERHARDTMLSGVWDEVLAVADEVVSKIRRAMTEEISREDDAPTDEQIKAVFSALYAAKIIQVELPAGYVCRVTPQVERRNYGRRAWEAALQGKSASGLRWTSSKKALWWGLDTLGFSGDKDKRCVFDAFGLKYSQSLKGKVGERLGDAVEGVIATVKNAMGKVGK